MAQPPALLKPMIAAVVSQITATVALAVCLAVAAVAAAFAIYQALRLALPDYLSSGLLAVLFLVVSAALMTWLHRSHQAKEQEEPPPKFGLRLLRDLAMAGAVTFIRSSGVRRR